MNKHTLKESETTNGHELLIKSQNDDVDMIRPGSGEQSISSPQFKHQELSPSRQKAEEKLAQAKRLKEWLPFALGAALNFFLGNCIISLITAEVDGLSCIFYLSAGAIFCGLIHMTFKSIQKGSWHHQNLIVGGNVRWMNVLRFGIQCCLFFGIQSFIFLTMYYAHMADVNVGIITTIWSIQPLAAATLDYFIYGEKLRMHHLMGMVFVIGSGLCISLSSKTNTVDVNLGENFGITDLQKLDGAKSPFLAGYPSGFHYDTKMLSVSFDPKVPKWVAVLFGLLTPVFFVTSGLFIKHLTSPRVGFDAMTISFATSFFSSTLIIILGVTWFWQSVEVFNTRLFVIGIFGSIFDSVGKACIQKAYSKGPAGPVSAFVELNNVFLVVFEAARYWKLPHLFEFVGFLLGIVGALVLCIPDEIVRMFSCIKRVFVGKKEAQVEIK